MHGRFLRAFLTDISLKSAGSCETGPCLLPVSDRLAGFAGAVVIAPDGMADEPAPDGKDAAADEPAPTQSSGLYERFAPSCFWCKEPLVRNLKVRA